MSDKKCKNMNRTLILCLVIIFAFLVYITFFKVNLLMFDDAIYACIIKPYKSNTLINNFIIDTATEHYQLIAVFFSKFFGSILPEFLGFHPQDFVMHFAHYIKAVFFILSIFAMTFFTFLNNKKNSVIFSVSFLFLFFTIIIITMTYAPATFSLYSAFFRFQIPLIYLSLFLYFFAQDYINNQFKNKNLLISLFLLNITDGNEITITIIQLFLLLMFTLNIKKGSLKFITGNRLLTALYLIIPSTKLLLTIFTNRYNNEFLNFLNFSLIKDFSFEYIKFIFCSHLPCFLIFGVVFVFYILKIQNEKIIKIVSSIFLSLLIFLYSLIFYGKVVLVETEAPVYLLSHWHLQANVDILLLLLTMILLIQCCMRYKKLKEILIFTFTALSLFIFAEMNSSANAKYTFTRKGLHYNERKIFYKFEKSFLELIKKYNGQVYLKYEPTDTIDIYNLKYIMFYYYIAGIYKLNPDNYTIIFTTNDIAEQKLKDTGISYSEKELNTPEFKDLYKILK